MANREDLTINLLDGDDDEKYPHQLVGFVISDKFLNLSAVIRILTQTWQEIGWVHLEPIHDNRTYSITVDDVAAGQRFMAWGSWSVKGYSFSIHNWPWESRLEDLPLHLLSIWIQVHGLPLCQMTLENAKVIGAHVGLVLTAEDPHSPDGWRGFLRI